MENRRSLKIAVTEDADEAVERFSDREGMTKQAVASRVYQWFAEQPETLQRWVLGQIADDTKERAREVLAGYFRRAEPGSSIAGTARPESGPTPLNRPGLAAPGPAEPPKPKGRMKHYS